MKLIIDLDEIFYEGCKKGMVLDTTIHHLIESISNGTPLDDVIGMIDKAYDDLDGYDPYALGEFANMVSDILDNIGKAESEDKE